MNSKNKSGHIKLPWDTPTELFNLTTIVINQRIVDLISRNVKVIKVEQKQIWNYNVTLEYTYWTLDNSLRLNYYVKNLLFPFYNKMVVVLFR